MAPITFALQCTGADLGGVAVQAEAAGFAAIAVPDHPGTTWSPFVALASAAAATSRLFLATAVVNGGVREPLDIAADAATLQTISGGRLVLGLGAGHTPAEWSQVGQAPLTPAARIDRLEEVARATVALLRGEVVDVRGGHVTLQDARLAMDLPPPPALLIGGGNRRLLRLGCELADFVELTGSGRTLGDGHHHEPRWSEAQVDAAVATFQQASEAAGRTPALGALVQHVALTDDAEREAGRFRSLAAGVLPEAVLPTVADLIACPYFLIGTVDEITTKLRGLSQRWGFTRFTVRALDATAAIITALAAGPTGEEPAGPRTTAPPPRARAR